MASDAVIIENLSKDFLAESGVVHALKNITLNIKAGTLTALVGPDGAGKTTLLRIIAGLLSPSLAKKKRIVKDLNSTVSVLGIDATRDPQQVQNLISYMPQRFGLYEDLSVQENLDLYADLHGVYGEEREKRYHYLLQMTNLAKFTDRLAGRLSGGMKQKLGLMCTLIRVPKLLLLDEPTVGVDPLSRRELWVIVNKLVREEKLSVLVSTSYLDEAARCEYVYVINEGEILTQGTPKEITAEVQGRSFLIATKSRLRDIQTSLFDNYKQVVDAVPQSGGIRFVLSKGVNVSDVEMLRGCEVTPQEASLEDSFMSIIREKSDSNRKDSFQIKGDTDTEVKSFEQHNENIIEVENLVKKFGNFTAVNNTSFVVKRGEIFGLLGPNGAGKTTTFRMLCGLLMPTSGKLQVAGVNLGSAPSTARKKIGYVAQKFSLYGNLTVKENLEFFAGLYSFKISYLQKRLKEVIEEFELGAYLNTQSGILPGGYKQRLAMAVGLLHEPEVLFLDEPTSGTDPLARRMFWRHITELARRGITIVVTTHFMEEAEYCDRIVIQDAGSILALGTPQEVREVAGGDNTLSMEEAFIEIIKNNRAGGELC